MKSKFIELIGIGLPNRGAEFMAATVISYLQSRYHELKFCTQSSMPDVDLRRYGLVRASATNSFVIRAGRVAELFIDVSGKQFEVYGSIDLSGFAYGDFWGVNKAIARVGSRLPSWRNFGYRYWIFPQAMGPFDDEGFTPIIKDMASVALEFAVRDKRSFEFVNEISPWTASLMPDICFTEDHQTYDSILVTEPYGLIIPNSKLIESGQLSLEKLVSLIKQVQDFYLLKGLKPVLLNHEGMADALICDELSKIFNIPSFQPSSISEIIPIISNSDFVFSSRYHGIISAIKYKRPFVTLGWSHKYAELLKDFHLDSLISSDCTDPLATFEKVFIQYKNKEFLSSQDYYLAMAQKKLDQFWKNIRDDIDML
jgi:polysaccharide pyruvyl transferase WcaK-like protein